MRTWKLLLICIALGGMSAGRMPPAGSEPAAGGPALIPPEGIRVAAVDVRGNQRISRATILATVSARPGNTITRAQLEKDVQNLRGLGYFQSVAPPVVTLTPEGAHITYVVQEFPRVRAVEFTGNTVLTKAELIQILAFKPAEAFNREALTRRLSAVENAYRARGYIVRVLSDNIQISPEGILTIPLHEVRVAAVNIQGLQHVREAVIRQALRLQPGMLFNEADVERDFNRLQQFGLFETVEPDVTFNAAGDAVITWYVKEGRSRALNFGLSYGPSEGLVGSVSFTENNFRGRAEQLRLFMNISSVNANVGGEIAYTKPMLGRNLAYNARIFSLPEYRFNEDLVSAPGLDLSPYYERHTGVQLNAIRDQGRNRLLTVGSRFEAVNVFNLPQEFFVPGTPGLDGSLLVANGEYSIDTRNSLFYPTLGHYAVGAADAGFAESSGLWSFIIKPQGELRLFRALRPSRAVTPAERARERIPVLAGRLMAGVSVGDLPFFEQYFIGGIYDLRGYLQDRFWGKYMVVGTGEFRWPFTPKLVGVVFADVGDAWSSDFQFAEEPGFSTDFRQDLSFHLHAGIGAGLRYLSPLGPLRLEFAFGDKFRSYFAFGQQF